MVDRRINFGDPADSGTRWQIEDDANAAGGGNFVLAKDLDGNTVLLQYNPTSDAFEFVRAVDMGGEDVTGVGGVVGASGAGVYDDATTTVGDGTTSADHESVSTVSLNNRVAVKSESDLAGLAAGQRAYIPPETTVNITSDWRPPSGVSLDIHGTLRQGDGADIGGYLVQFIGTDDVTIRVFGTVDGNQSGQSTSQTGLFQTFNNGSDEPVNNSVYGPGEVVGMEGNNVIRDNGGESTYFGGLEVKNWTPGSLSDSFVNWINGNDTSDNFLIEGVTFRGDTFGGTAGDGDCVAGPQTDQTGLIVRGCDFFNIPRRGIQGAHRAEQNRIVNPAQPGGGGDAIASCRFITDNFLIGTFDSNGDNAIVLFGDTVCTGNYIEGFTNNGIGFDNGTGDARLFIVTNNWCIDNNQAGTPGNGNIRMQTTNSTGGFITKENICFGDTIDPLNNIVVGSAAENGRVTENIATGATTDIDDRSPASTTVAENITI